MRKTIRHNAKIRSLRDAEAEKKGDTQSRKQWATLPINSKMEVLRAFIKTRELEIKNAFKSIVGLGFGWRTTRSVKTLKNRKVARSRLLKPQFCLKIFVDKKISNITPEDGRIPSEFLAVSGFNPEPEYCLIPTDIESMKDYKASFQHQRITVNNEEGSVSCLVQIPNRNEIFGMSCHHVLDGIDNDYTSNRPVNLTNGYIPLAQVGTVSGYRGILSVDTTNNFDSGLIVLSENLDIEKVKSFVPEMGLRWGSWGDILNSEYSIPTIHGNVIGRHWFTFAKKQLIPGIPHGLRFSCEVVQYKFSSRQSTIRGDSGSPVLDSTHRILLGMHFAGSGVYGYMLPAPDLMKLINYVNGQTSDVLKIL